MSDRGAESRGRGGGEEEEEEERRRRAHTAKGSDSVLPSSEGPSMPEETLSVERDGRPGT